MASVAIIGTGYVGLVSGACLADFGNYVTCVDINRDKIESLKKGKIPIYEPGLEDVVIRNTNVRRLSFTQSMEEAVSANDVIFIAVGTPPMEDGSADLTHTEDAARNIGKIINSYKVIVAKSTIPIGTTRKIKQWIEEEISFRINNGQLNTKEKYFDIISNPEFLREGVAVQDFTHPDRVVIGYDNTHALSIMKDVYRSLYLNETPFIETTFESAEMIKYASNAFLSVKISFINEIANLCDVVGADIQDVSNAMGHDPRIGNKYLNPGPGYGGSCFPKDTRALLHTSKEANSPLLLIESATKANENQKIRMVNKILNSFNTIQGKKFSVLGLSFKPNTDDMRESPSLTIINSLIQKGAYINVSDPAALEEAKWRLADNIKSISFFTDEYEAIADTDALIIITEWNQYRNLDFTRIKKIIKSPVLFDLRNIYKRNTIEKLGFSYFAVGQ